MTRAVVAKALEVVECCHEVTTYKGSADKLTLSQKICIFLNLFILEVKLSGFMLC